MKLAHFYHVFAGGMWRDPLAEHLGALAHAGYDGPFHIGLVGDRDQRAQVLDELRWIRKPDTVTVAEAGWEQLTLTPLLQHARENPGAILYAHTKGAHDPSTINVAWRRSMTFHLIEGWRLALTALDRDPSVQAVGCHWLTPEQFPGNVGTAPMPCFGGNFWMARTTYLRRLPACATTSRHDAEGWVGQLNPRVLDLTPGWPGNFGPVKHRPLIAAR